MAKFSEQNVTKQHIRSISLPTRSHPTALRIEEELKKSKILEELCCSPTFDTISFSLFTLKELYNLMDDLLNLQSTREIISHQRHENWVDQLLDGSIKLLDICNIVKEYMVQMKEYVRDLQSAFRRKWGDSTTTEVVINRFMCFRKRLTKDAKKLVTSIKRINHTLSYVCIDNVSDTNAHMSSLVTSLREVGEKNIAIFESILLFLSTSSQTSQSGKWALVSKMMNKRIAIASCEENTNELQNLDAIFQNICKSRTNEKMHRTMMPNARKILLKDLEIGVERVENGLEDIFRRLIITRASLLNIISQ